MSLSGLDGGLQEWGGLDGVRKGAGDLISPRRAASAMARSAYIQDPNSWMMSAWSNDRGDE